MQREVTNEVLELIRRTSSSLPKDVEERLKTSIEKEEPGSAARGALETIMKNIELSRANSTPICQDTGTPIFYVHYSEGMSTRKLKEQINIFVLEPGKPNCRYHREDAQEDFLILAGNAKLLVNGEEHPVGPWDFVHCPAGTTHVFVGDGDSPCALLAIGYRPGKGKERIFYPANELARRYSAEAPQPTPDPKDAYSNVKPRVKGDPPKWPVA